MNNEFKLRTAGEGELQALLGLWTAVLHPDPAVFTSMYNSCLPVKRKTFVIECDDKIVSSVQLFILPIRDEQCRAVHIGAIANVSTLDEYRHRGYATKLLLAATDDMKAAGCSWSFLFTGIAPYYEKLGWRIIHRTYLAVNVPSSFQATSSAEVIVQDPPDIERLRMLSESSFVTPLSQIRGDLDWKFKIPPRIAEKTIFMGEDSYAIVRESDGNVVLEEWGMPDPSIFKFQNLIESVAQWTAGKGIRRLVIAAPILAQGRQVLETLFSSVDEVEEAGAMVRPLSSRWPMSRLVSLFSLPEARFLRLDSF